MDRLKRTAISSSACHRVGWKAVWGWLALALIGLLIVSLSITQGAVVIPAGQSFLALADAAMDANRSTLSASQQMIIVEIRWPRTLFALLVGAILALCGAVMQGVFRNPIADPGIIGVSSGAALGAAIAIVLLPATMGGMLTPFFAFFSGLLTTLLVYRLAQSTAEGAGTSVLMLLLAGVAMAALSSAAVGLLTYIADDKSLRSLTLWGMGSLTYSDGSVLSVLAVSLLLLWGYFQYHAKALNALVLGEAQAMHLGVDTEKLKRGLIIAVSIGVALAVSASGLIGFISLVVPHLIRLTMGPDHRYLLFLSLYVGAILLLLADIGARVLLAPAEIPVGLITAFIGAPFLVFLLLSQRQRLSQF